MSAQKFERLMEVSEGLGLAYDSVDKDGHSNPSPNPNEGQDAGGQTRRAVGAQVMPVVRVPTLCCGISARTWAKVGIILHMFGWGLVLAVLALAFLGIFEAASDPDTLKLDTLSNEDQNRVLELLSDSKVILFSCVFASVIIFFVSALGLHGVNTNKVGLITFWMVYQGIGVAGQIFQFLATAFATEMTDVVFKIVALGLGIFFLIATIKCRDEALRARAVVAVANYKFSA